MSGMLKSISLQYITLGSDPEGFIKKDGYVIGSERILGESGFVSPDYNGKIVRDGVQFEMQPQTQYAPSLTTFQAKLGKLFTTMIDLARKRNAEVSLDGMVTVAREELDALSPAARALGCMPSLNAYGFKPIGVDPATYPKRSAGGHIHIGCNNYGHTYNERERMIPIFDVLVGLTSVLLDRDEGAAERRENYGRAGEYRLPYYGVEYRTTSNFWLHDPVLMNLVFSLAIASVNVAVAAANGTRTPWNDLASVVTIKSVQKAIDTNDYNQAKRQFKKLIPFIQTHMDSSVHGLGKDTLDGFLALSETIRDKGINSVFPAQNRENRWLKHSMATFKDFIIKA
jgi:hypothetical protein